MRGRLSKRLHSILTILFFSLLLTMLFIGCVLLVEYHSLRILPDNAKAMYALSSADYSRYVREGSFYLDPNRLMSWALFTDLKTQAMLGRLLESAVLFFIAISVVCTIFWLQVRKMLARQTLQTASELLDSMDESEFTGEPILEETYLKMKEKFDARLEDFKRLNSYISHEQKNEMAILRMRMELEDDQTGLDAIDDLTSGIDDILTLSENLDTSAMGPVDVTMLCADVFDVYRKANPNLTFTFGEEDDTEILAKSRWIKRAVANLLDNAIKYGLNKPVSLSVHAQKGSVIVSVRDHGIGMEPEKLEMIFSDRYRINHLNKDGYGIGLSLVSHVCDLCGGTAAVESMPGQGSTFYLSFPQAVNS